MSLLNSILKVFIPNKSKKDLKEAEPIIKQIHEKESNLEKLSNDQLRSIKTDLKKQITELKKPFQDKIDEIKDIISKSNDIDENEKNYTEIDKIENNYLDQLDIFLDKILPTAFALVKETAKRFATNDYIEVSCSRCFFGFIHLTVGFHVLRKMVVEKLLIKNIETYGILKISRI